MKSLFLLFLLVMVGQATPSRVTWDTEVLLGTDAKEYAVLRTYHDTLGSYYADESKTYLDEFSKESGERIRSTLLYSRKISIDAADESNISETRTAENKELKLADVLAKYNVSLVPKVMPKWSDRLQWNMQGICLDDSAHVFPIYSHELKEKYGLEQDQSPEDGLLGEITEIVVEEGAVFLTLSIDYSYGGDDGGGMSSKVVYLSATKAKRLLDWTKKDEMYLQVGNFETEAAAREAAQKLTKLSEVKKVYYPDIQIWSKSLPRDQMTYLVVLGDAKQRIMNDGVEKLNGALEVNLVPTSSKNFRDRFPVN
jgi:hypothetical protein